MHGSVSLDLEIVDNDAASLSAIAPASLYGKGVFTTLAIHRREPFLWEKHWSRITQHSTRVGIHTSDLHETAIRNALGELIEANTMESGRARITFFDMSASGLWPAKTTTRRTSVLITTAEFTQQAVAPKLTVSPFRLDSRSPLAGIKSCNYLERILVRWEAEQRGFTECVQLNERDEVTSAAMANLFWLRDGRMFTPSLKTGCLAGTTREFVLENLECVEVDAGIEDLRSVEEIFITSAGLGIMQIAEFDGRKLEGRSHVIANLLPEPFGQKNIHEPDSGTLP